MEIRGASGYINKGDAGGGSEALVPCVQNWSVNDTAELSEVISSCTAEAPLRVDGNTDWNGTYNGLGALPNILPGDEFLFYGITEGDDTGAKGVKGEAICDQAVINFDYETGAIITHQVDFSAKGALDDAPGVAGVTEPVDASPPATPETAAGLDVEVAGTPTFASYSSLHSVRQATLTLTRNNPDYASSRTGGARSRLLGNFDATLSLNCYAEATNAFDNFPKANELYRVQLYTTASLFWLLSFMKVVGRNNMSVNIETGEPTGITIEMALHASTEISATPTRGVITKPGGGDLWPA